MRMLTRLIAIAVALAGVAAVIVFMLQNQQPTSLVFLGWATPQLSLAIPVIIALLTGMLIGPLLSWSVSLRKKR